MCERKRDRKREWKKGIDVEKMDGEERENEAKSVGKVSSS